MNSFTSHLLVSVLILFLLERVLHILKIKNESKKAWEMFFLTIIAFYIILGLFFPLP